MGIASASVTAAGRHNIAEHEGVDALTCTAAKADSLHLDRLFIEVDLDIHIR